MFSTGASCLQWVLIFRFPRAFVHRVASFFSFTCHAISPCAWFISVGVKVCRYLGVTLMVKLKYLCVENATNLSSFHYGLNLFCVLTVVVSCWLLILTVYNMSSIWAVCHMALDPHDGPCECTPCLGVALFFEVVVNPCSTAIGIARQEHRSKVEPRRRTACATRSVQQTDSRESRKCRCECTPDKDQYRWHLKCMLSSCWHCHVISHSGPQAGLPGSDIFLWEY